MKVRSVRYSLHAGGWIFFYFLPYLLSFRGVPDIHTMFSDSGDVVHLISYLMLVGFSYLNYLVFVPRLFLKRSYFLYILVITASLLAITALPMQLEPGHMPHRPPMPGAPPPLLFGMNYNIILFLVSVFVSIMMQYRLQLMRIEKEKLDAELSFLKAQVNPHFLFNTLNSIYALAIQKSDRAPEAIVQLSSLMRYIISDAHLEFVDLQKEIDYLRNYVDLQRNRLGETVAVTLGIEGSGTGLKIAPLLLMSFIENAFKHGVNPDEDSRIDISLIVKENNLRLHVKNRKVSATGNGAITGIGLRNTRDRLQHFYPGRHELLIGDEAGFYSVNLTLQL